MATKEEVLMKGTHAAIIQSAKENFDVEDCICELVDNAIDSKATKVDIGFEDKKDGTYSFHFVDNGHGMNYDMVTKIFSNFKSHLIHPNENFERERVGIKGEGMKYALLGMIYSIHQDYKSKIRIQTSVGDDTIINVEWNISTSNAMEEDFRHPTIITRKNDCGFKGTMLTVDNCAYYQDYVHGLGGFNKNSNLYINRIEKALSQRYALPLKSGLSIRYCTHMIKGWDRLYLDLLPNNAKDGVHVISKGELNYVFFVKTAALYSSAFEDRTNVRYIILYVSGNKNYYETDSAHGGVYAIKGDRYILCGNKNSRTILGDGTTNFRKASVIDRCGPEGRIRTLLFFNNNNSNIFGIYTNKSKGVAPLNKYNGYKETYVCLNGYFYDGKPTTLCNNVILDRNLLFAFNKIVEKTGVDESNVVDFFYDKVDYINFNGKEIDTTTFRSATTTTEVQPSVEEVIATIETEKKEVKKPRIKLVTFNNTLGKYDYSRVEFTDDVLVKLLPILEHSIDLAESKVSQKSKEDIICRFIKEYMKQNS